MIKQSNIIETLGKGFTQQQKNALAETIIKAFEEGTEDMATLKDVKIAVQGSQIALIASMFTCAGLIIAAITAFHFIK